MDMFEKLKILTDAAKYDVACTSSGSDRRGRQGVLGNAVAAGICHSFAADGRCISLLKVLLSNDCAYDCAYCVNRRSAKCRRATFTPEELCSLTMEFYRRNYIEGLFLSSAVVGSPDATCERMLAVLKTLRERCRFGGYVHVKAIPGASPELTYQLGLLRRPHEREHRAAQPAEPKAAGPSEKQGETSSRPWGLSGTASRRTATPFPPTATRPSSSLRGSPPR